MLYEGEVFPVAAADQNSDRYRRVLGQYPTGVVVVTATDAKGEPLGMTVGSFTSVSIDPQLVAFLPQRSSSSWSALRAAGTSFGVNILSAEQEEVCRAIAMRKSDKFDGIAWTPSHAGNPIIEGATAFIDCEQKTIHSAGDHDIVIGRVIHLESFGSIYPLLFFQGGYGSFRPNSLASGDADLIDSLPLLDAARETMDRTAAEFDTEVTAVCLVGNELVLAAASGRSAVSPVPTRVGQRFPFMPPMGGLYAAWGAAELANRWLASAPVGLEPEVRRHLSSVPSMLKTRGYTITLGHEPNAELELEIARAKNPPSPESQMRQRQLIAKVSALYNPPDESEPDRFELRSVAAPVFNEHGQIAFTLTLWGPGGSVGRAEVDRYVAGVLACAETATDRIGGRAPQSAVATAGE